MGKTISLVLGFLCALTSVFAEDKAGGSVKPAYEHAVYRYLTQKLKVEKPGEYDLTYGFYENTVGLGEDRLTNPTTRLKIANSYFAPESAEALRQILEALMKTDYSNAMVLAEAGVGKSFLLNQLVAMYSYGIFPDYVKKEINFPESDTPYAKILKAFFGNTHIVRVNTPLLTRNSASNTEPFASEEQRMRRVLQELFAAARSEFNRFEGDRRVGKRTLFIFDEFAILPPFVKEVLKTILDETGFQNPDLKFTKKPDPGFAVIGITTPDEYRRVSAGDSAVERRYKVVKLAEPSEKSAFRIVRAKADDEWEELYGILISDDAIWHLIHSRKFLTSPPLAMPGSILAAINQLFTWKLTNPGDSPEIITLKDAQLYMTRQAGLTDAWLEGPNGEPPLYDLEQRAAKYVVAKDNSLKKIAERWKTFSRLEHNGSIPVFIIMGPTGSGKDTRFEALNMALFGHRGKRFNFSLAGKKGFGIDALIEGPPLGNHSDREQGLLVRALDSGVGNSAIAFNEAADAPSEELEKLKVLVESGEIRPSGLDSRPRPLRYPIFLMGQWGEEIYEGLTDEEKMEKYRSLTQEQIEGFLLKGKGDGMHGAVPPALLERAKKSGGIYAIPPVVAADFPAVVGIWLPSLIEDLQKNNGITLVIDPALIQFIARTAAEQAHGTRGLSAVASDFTKGALSRAMDEGMPRNHANLVLTIEGKGEQTRVVVEDKDSQRKYSYAPTELYRHKLDCKYELDSFGRGVE